MPGKLDAKVAIVTGAGRGIGRGIALLMAKEGAKVVVADNGSLTDGTGGSRRPAQQTVEEIAEAGGTAIADFGDVSSFRDAEAIVNKAVKSFGKLDILVNAAGNFRLGTIASLTEKDWDDIIRVHMRGTFAMAHFAAGHWVQRGEYGRLINFTSGAGTRGLPTMVSYSAAKAGIVGLTRATANALARYNVTANCISPGAATRMMDRALERSRQQFKETGKWPSQVQNPDLDPNAVAPLAVYLASQAAANISGRIFGAAGRRYTLWSEPDEARQLWSDGAWDLDRLFREFPQTLGRAIKLDDLPNPMEDINAVPKTGDSPEY